MIVSKQCFFYIDFKCKSNTNLEVTVIRILTNIMQEIIVFFQLQIDTIFKVGINLGILS